MRYTDKNKNGKYRGVYCGSLGLVENEATEKLATIEDYEEKNDLDIEDILKSINILKTKDINLRFIKKSPNLSYSSYLDFFNNPKLVVLKCDDCLTEEEFDIIKKIYCKRKKNKKN